VPSSAYSPLVLLLVIICALFWPAESEAQQQAGEMEEAEDDAELGPVRGSAPERLRLAGSESTPGKVLAAPLSATGSSILRALRQIRRTVVEREARPGEGAPPMPALKAPG